MKPDEDRRQPGILEWTMAIIALGIATFLIFQNLAQPAIRQWDEAIYADNSLDMYMTGDPIVMRRNGEVTFYNTKPPLVIWLQTLSMHVFGVNEFAIRFPSAMAGVFTCVLLLWFSLKTLKDIRIGIIAVLVLGTAYGFVKQHMVKTGDLDAVLVFCTTWYTLLFLHFLLTKPVQYKTLFTWVGIGIIFAFLSKAVAGLMPVAGLFVCALIMKKAKWILTQKHTWIMAAIVLFTCVGYYALREALTPGYVDQTRHSEYDRFFTNVMTWHNHPWYYYFWNWQRLEFFTPYVFWLPVAIAIGLTSKEFHMPVVLLVAQVLVFVGILSYPIVKLMWYDAPVYPFLALLCAIGVVVLFDFVRKKIQMQEITANLILGILLIALFFIPVRDMYKRNAELRLPVDILEREGFFVRELHRTTPDIKEYKVLMLAGQNAHFTQIDFYMNAYNRHKGYDIAVVRDTALVQVGDTIAVCQEKQIEWLHAHFQNVEISKGETGCVLIRVGERKESQNVE